MKSINSTSSFKSSNADFVITQSGTITIKIAASILIFFTSTKEKIKYKAAKGAKVKGYDRGFNGEKCRKNTDKKTQIPTSILLFFFLFIY